MMSLAVFLNHHFILLSGLTKQHVSDFDSIEVLMEQGSRLRFVSLAKIVFRLIYIVTKMNAILPFSSSA